MRLVFRAVSVFMVLFCTFGFTNAWALQSVGGRLIKLTLIPDYVDHLIRFDGMIDVGDASKGLDLAGLPLNVQDQWKEQGSTIWNITGVIIGGSVVHDAETDLYHLVFGPVALQPDDTLDLILPFVNLDYAQIRPPEDTPSPAAEISRQLTHFFSYNAGDAERQIQQIDIPFRPIVKKIDLVLVPLIGEALAGKTSGLRLAGTVQFGAIEDFGEFTRYCQITPRRLKEGDYRMGNLLYDLDFPSYFGPDVLNPIYQYKPTITGLRSELTACHYDKENGVSQVTAVFSGRVVDVAQSADTFPDELQGTDFPDGNYAFIPPLLFKGVSGYEIRLGKIVLAPGDTLTITVPHAQVQADNLRPVPITYEDTTGSPKISYTGPMSFELSLPYIPQTQLYTGQFPAIIRPTIALVEEQAGSLFPVSPLNLSWGILGLGLVLLVLSKSTSSARWAAVAGWLLISIGFFYGVRGSFGLLCVAATLYISETVPPEMAIKNYASAARKTALGLVSFALIALAVYVDTEGTNFFRGLSEPDLSPLTPLVLMIVVGCMFVLFYGIPKDAKLFKVTDLPVLLLLLFVIALYDAFDKSLFALLILCLGGFYLSQRALQESKGDQAQLNENEFGIELQTRWKLAFKNRVIPVAIVILIVFATVHELSTTFANEMQLALSPLLAPVVIPLLAFASVFLAFASIALLFVLIYPFLPSKTGYLKATIFALFLFLIFFFGIGTDDRLMASLPNILVGRVIYYFSVPVLIGLYIDIHEFMQKENKRLAAEGKHEKDVNFQTAGSLYLKNIQGWLGTVTGIVSLLAPSIYAFVSDQPAISTYFSLLETLVLLPI